MLPLLQESERRVVAALSVVREWETAVERCVLEIDASGGSGGVYAWSAVDCGDLSPCVASSGD